MAAMLAVLAVACPAAKAPRIVWNVSPSVPVGLYRLLASSPARGGLVVIRLPEPFLTLAGDRGYLPTGILLIKPIAAAAGDLVCRHGALVTINGRTVALARTADAWDRPLPGWQGCRRLNAHQIFVLSPAPDSFDSRYFGPLDRRHIVGMAMPVWTFEGSLRSVKHQG
jgi:conjugative transfer signal peptidase TraF